jgi:hypothetical protein
MRRNHRADNDSLELLLDTMCDIFGTIILIAVLVALLSQQVQHIPDHSSESSEIMKRKIAKALTDIKESEQYLAQLQLQAASSEVTEKMDLVRRKKVLQEELNEMTKNSKDTEDFNELSANDDQKVKTLKTQVASLTQQKATEQSAYNSKVSKKNALEKHATSLEASVGTEEQKSVHRLRLPKERKMMSKKPMYVIARYGLLYPTHEYSSGFPKHNNDTIQWKERGYGSTEATPKEGKGMTPREFSSYLKKLSGEEFYMAFLLYEDSFGIFNESKETCFSDGFDYGLRPIKRDEPIIFSVFGSGVPGL